MPSYRCYFLDGEEHIRHRADIEAGGLSEAIEKASELLKSRPQDHGLEIWQGETRLYPAPTLVQRLLRLRHSLQGQLRRRQHS